jgi:hypothetical protein
MFFYCSISKHRVDLAVLAITDLQLSPTCEQQQRVSNLMGSAGFEPAVSSARGWHHTKLDNDPYVGIVISTL